MTGVDSKGTLYFNENISKFGKNVFIQNGFVDNHDIKVDTQTKDGKPIALTVQVANPGTLALDKDTFERKQEPTAYIKCDYTNYPSNKLYSMVKTIISVFDRYKENKPRQYYAMYGGTANKIPKDYFEDVDYYDDEKYGRK